MSSENEKNHRLGRYLITHWGGEQVRAFVPRVACQLLADEKAVREMARTFNVHEATIYRLAAAS
jgi:hypothetical protein